MLGNIGIETATGKHAQIENKDLKMAPQLFRAHLSMRKLIQSLFMTSVPRITAKC